MLLPTQHSEIRVQTASDESFGAQIEVTFRDRRWMFPREDCILLEIPNTTTELLARLIGQNLLEAIEAKTSTRPSEIRLAVDENHGQWGVWHYLADP